MSNSSCSFHTIDDLITQASRIHQNISTLVALCPGICSQAWGNGNPDLSGIGLNVSYVMQAVLSFVCGLLLCLIYILLRLCKIHKRINNLEKTMSSIQATFLDTAISFSIPIAIAAIVRARQGPPFYERFFMIYVVTMQSLSYPSVVMTIGAFAKFNKNTRPGTARLSGRRAIVIFISLCLQVGLATAMAVTFGVKPPSTWASIKELLDTCNIYNHVYVDPNQYDPKALWLYVPLMLLGCIMFGGIPVFVLTRVRMNIIPLVILPALLLNIFTPHFAVILEHTRNSTRTIIGADFQDDKWSFGQIIAVLLWIPLCIELVWNVICLFVVLFGKRYYTKFGGILRFMGMPAQSWREPHRGAELKKTTIIMGFLRFVRRRLYGHPRRIAHPQGDAQLQVDVHLLADAQPQEDAQPPDGEKGPEMHMRQRTLTV